MEGRGQEEVRIETQRQFNQRDWALRHQVSPDDRTLRPKEGADKLGMWNVRFWEVLGRILRAITWHLLTHSCCFVFWY